MIIIKVIEMIGLPGSGKSYLIDNLSVEGVESINECTFYEYCKSISRSKKIIDGIINTFLSIDIIVSLYLYILFSCEKKKYAIQRVKEIIKYMTLYSYIIRKKTKSKYVIMDQGIIQYIWSLKFHDKNGTKESNILKYICKRINKKFPLNYFYYKIDYELAAERASTRNSKCTIDKLGYDKIKEMYKAHSEDYRVFLEYLPKTKTFLIENEEQFIQGLMQMEGKE